MLSQNFHHVHAFFPDVPFHRLWFESKAGKPSVQA